MEMQALETFAQMFPKDPTKFSRDFHSDIAICQQCHGYRSKISGYHPSQRHHQTERKLNLLITFSQIDEVCIVGKLQ